MFVTIFCAFDHSLQAQTIPCTVLEHGPHHRMMEGMARTAAPPGRPVWATNRYTELATGLHYWRDGQWLEAQELIEPAPGGARAVRGQHSVAFAANANTAGAVHLSLPDGRHVRAHVLGLRY